MGIQNTAFKSLKIIHGEISFTLPPSKAPPPPSPKKEQPPSPRFSILQNGPPPPLFCIKQAPTPPSFQSQKVRFAWSVRRTGEGAPPLRQRRGGGWGDRMKGWGYPPLLRIRKGPPPASGNFCEPAPTPLLHENGAGWGVGLWWRGIPPPVHRHLSKSISLSQTDRY